MALRPRAQEGRENGGGIGTWFLVVGLALAVALWGTFLFLAIGDKGPSPWDFNAVADLPGSSPYAVHGPHESPVLGPAPVLGARPVVPQHIGAEGRR